MTDKSTRRTSPSDIRSTALRHAFGIEERKRLKARVADLVLEAYDLPSSTTADPAYPAAADAILFQECLSLFQPGDLDDLVQERNIDDRCGYALCPRPNRKVTSASEKVWNQRRGKDFKIVDRAEMERWCSKACGNRTAFVRAQLSSEPSWLRETKIDVRLLDDVGGVEDMSGATKVLAEIDVNKQVIEKLQALSLERGDTVMEDVSDQVPIVERSNSGGISVPPSRGDQSIEGHRPRKVRFAPSEATTRTPT